TGNILFAQKVAIGPDDTAGDLHDQLMTVGAGLLVKTVKALAAGKITPIPQDHLIADDELKHAPKIFKEDGKIDWHRPVDEVHNLIRGLSPYPTAYTELDGHPLKIFKSAKERTSVSHPVGTYYTDGTTFLKFACPDGYIDVREVQLAGKKRMDIEAFLRGYRPRSVTIFT